MRTVSTVADACRSAVASALRYEGAAASPAASVCDPNCAAGATPAEGATAADPASLTGAASGTACQQAVLTGGRSSWRCKAAPPKRSPRLRRPSASGRRHLPWAPCPLTLRSQLRLTGQSGPATAVGVLLAPRPRWGCGGFSGALPAVLRLSSRDRRRGLAHAAMRRWAARWHSRPAAMFSLSPTTIGRGRAGLLLTVAQGGAFACSLAD